MADTSVIIKRIELKEAYNEAKRVTKNFYDFLAEDRTFTPFIRSIFQGLQLLLQITAYFALFLSFIVNRFRKMVLSRAEHIC